MQTSLSAMLQTPASRRLAYDAFFPDDEVPSASLSVSDFFESDLPEAVRSKSPSNHPFGSRAQAEAVECPKCNKRSIVRRSHNTFDCLNCSFHKELAPIATSDPALRPKEPTLRSKASRQLIYSQLPTARPSFDELEDICETDKIQPLVFAAIAVIVGIIIL